MAQETDIDMEKRKFYNGDILARLLIDRMHLTPIRLSLISVVLFIGYSFIFSWVSNTLALFLDDRVAWVYSLFFVPVLAGYYLWGSNAMEGLIKDIRKSGTIDISDRDENAALSFYQNPWRMFSSLSIAVIMGVMYFISRSYVFSWTSAGLIPKLSSTISFIVGIYLASMLALTLITNIWVLHQILHNKKFHLSPLHPDRCGGLKSLGEYSLKTAYLAVVAGLVIGLTINRFIETGWYYWMVVLELPLYIAWVSACFFAPLYTAHTRMKEAKEELLSIIAKNFDEDYLCAQNELNSSNTVKLKDALVKIQQEKILHDITDQHPVWPFDLKTFHKFSVALLTPLLPILFDFLKSIFDVLKPLLIHWLIRAGNI